MKNLTPGINNSGSQKPSDLETIALATKSGARANIVPRGAHIISWRPAQSDVEHMFVSKRAKYQTGTAIRGGVPIVFPQFSDRGPLAKHGFARLHQWQLLKQVDFDDHRSQAVLTLVSDAATRLLWPYDFAATYTVTLHDNRLEMQLQIDNTGLKAFTFTAALHTYLAVGDIETTRLYGLQGSQYVDYLEPRGNKWDTKQDHVQTENREAVLFRSAIDRIYRATRSPLILKSLTQNTEIHADGFADTVIWNPWAEGSKPLVDMADKEYQRMLCVEAAAVVNPVRLNPKESWAGRQVLGKF